MKTAEIIRTLRLSADALKAQQAMVEGLLLLENGEAELTRLSTRKALIETEVQDARTRAEKDMEQVKASANEKIRQVTEKVVQDEKRLLATLDTLTKDVAAMDGKKAILQAELASEVSRRNAVYAELAAKVRDGETKLSDVERRLAGIQAKFA